MAVQPSTVYINMNTETSIISEFPELDISEDHRTSSNQNPHNAHNALAPTRCVPRENEPMVGRSVPNRMALDKIGIHDSQNDKMQTNAGPNGCAPRSVQNPPMLRHRAQECVVSQNIKNVNHVHPSNVTEPARHPVQSHGMVNPGQMMQRMDGYHNTNNLNEEYKHSIHVPLCSSPTMLGLPTAFAPNNYNGIAEILEKATPAAYHRMSEHQNIQQTPQSHMMQRNEGYQDSYYFFPPQAYNYPMHAQLYPSPPIYEHPAVFAPNSYDDIAYWNGQFHHGMSARVTQYGLKTPSEASMEMFASISHRDFDFMHDFSYFTSCDVSPYGIPCISFDEISNLEREHRKKYSKYL
ncbi:hypothetical protein B9Z55_024804 [Caenorhabditis nigoni]|uniref:Uncharacterized protein n=1 Tax=Caenorhabditis nigoni TaxID=1611254 RepID=A0A2G5SWC0_9PELO|nr:hypothetical protein B9Z55_024804 [Caenorhabditis nigoni]